MKYKVTMTISDYVKIGDEYKTVKAEQKLTFANYDDLQNWQGYTLEALDGKALTITIKAEKEVSDEKTM